MIDALGVKIPPYWVQTVSGIDIVESPALHWEKAYHFPDKKIVICGSATHFRYRMAIAQIRLDMRADLERQLDAFARRVGVDRSTSSE